MLGGAQSQKEVERGRKGGSSVLGWNGQPSRTIDCYEFLEQVGEGTYGQVFKGRDKMTKEIVALKKIRFYSKGQGLPLTALREIKILKQLKHENMVCLKEIVTSVGSREWKNGASSSNVSGTVTEEDRRGSIYLVLEYVEHDLAGLLDHSYIFSVPAVKFVVKQLLKVLSHMHEHAYLHRDIKCSNLLIDNSYNLKVADFGLARRLALRSSGEGSSACDALTNKVITLWYRPPELLLGSRQYGPAVDLWGVGCIMAELLTGRPIFPGRNEMEQANMIFKVCGTPNDKSWPNHKNLAYCKKMIPSSSTYVDVLDTHLRTMAKKRPMQMDEHWDDFMTRETIQLIKRLLTLDPRRRCTAAAALSAGWFVTKPACPERASDLSPLNTNGASFHEWKTKKERKKVAELKQQQREAAISTSSVHSPDAVAGSELQQQQHIAPPLPPPSNPTPVNKPPPPCTTTQYHVQINSNNRYPQGNHESAVTALSCSVVNQAQATCAVSPPHPPLLSTSILPTTNNRKDEIAIEGDIEKKIILKKRREGLAKWYKQKQLKSSSSSSLDCEENGHHGCNRKLTSSTNDDVKNEGGTQMAGALESTPDSLHLSKRSEGVMSSSSHLRRGSSSDNYVESYAFVPSV